MLVCKWHNSKRAVLHRLGSRVLEDSVHTDKESMDQKIDDDRPFQRKDTYDPNGQCKRQTVLHKGLQADHTIQFVNKLVVCAKLVGESISRVDTFVIDNCCHHHSANCNMCTSCSHLIKLMRT